MYKYLHGWVRIHTSVRPVAFLCGFSSFLPSLFKSRYTNFDNRTIEMMAAMMSPLLANSGHGKTE
jgi:hypothetical protein